MASTEDNEDTRNNTEGTPQSPPQTSTTAVDNDLVAAVEKLGYGVDTDRILAELKLQSDKNKAEAEEFATKITNMSTPCVFVFMKQNSPYLHVIHSLGKFSGDLVVESDYNDSVIGFVGNRAGRVEPIPIEITNDMWSWKDHEIATDIIKVASFGEKEGNEDKMYKRTKTDDKEKVALPPVLLLPSGLVKWLLEKRRKPLDLHQKIKSMLTEDSVDDIPEYLNVSLKWCLAAAQCARTSSNEKSSLLVLTPSPIITQDPTTLAWIKARLNTTLGPPRDDRTPTVPPPQAFYQMPPTQQQNHQPTPQTSTTQGSSKKYNVLQKSALGGWCGTTILDQIPVVWTKLEEYQVSVEESRSIIMKEVQRVADEEGVEIYDFYLEDDMVKDIIQVKMAPNGRNPVWEALQRGMCILNCLPSTSKQKVVTQRRDKNMNETKLTRTYDEAEKFSKKDPRKPPGEYERVFKNITTYCMLLLALFGKRCAHYKECWTIRRVMKKLGGDAEQHFTGIRCRQLVWAIIVDSNNFFAERMMPEDFDDDDVDFPASLLHFAAAKVRLREDINSSDFPNQWQDSYQSPTEGHQNQGLFAQGFQAQGYQNQGWRGRLGGGGGDDTGCHSNTHPDIKKIMDPFIQSFKSVLLSAILSYQNKQLSDLPKIPQHTDSQGRSRACYSYIGGKCPLMNRGCQFVHVPGKDLSPQFVRQFCTIIEPGAKKFVQDGRVPPKPGFSPAKRGRDGGRR